VKARPRILLLHAGALGDVVNTLPAMRALKGAYPGAAVSALGNLSVLVLLESCGVVAEALSLDGPGLHSLFAGPPLSAPVRESLSSYDMMVSWIRAPHLIENLMSVCGKVAVLRQRFPPPSGSPHLTEFMAGPLLDLGVKTTDFEPRLRLPEEVKEAGPSFDGVIVHPGSGSRLKNFSPAKLAKAAKEISKKTGLPPAVLAGPADREAAAETLSAMSGMSPARFEGLSTLELAALLSGASLVLGNDSGVTHLAGALGTPVVAMFGPTDPAVWGVRQDHAINLSSPVECAPCGMDGAGRCRELTCLSALPVETITAAALRLMS